ncbi:MAG TPA: carboxylesterase/lipase family protein [Steroidobacteraceae bacterium]|jgi:para-nitrobenzyl esterase|nr:carboxylesterase/lipase family protein [Steroidobacteraceae bacterium]
MRTKRRELLKGAAAIACGAVGSGVMSEVIAAPASQGSRQAPLAAGDGEAVVATRAGRVAGYVRNAIYTFKGIPYADDTAGANRFMPPAKPKSWAGVRSSRQYGYVAPQGARGGWANDEEAFMFAWDDGVQGEDCLRVNVWTPGIGDHKKRPVMLWLHGGGYTAGSGQELRSYDGENLARRGDVVVVSLNHRLNVLGHLDLSGYGDQYAASGNLGMLDIVAALEWVRDNIENFGGDPGSVTIFGQSGGGGKVSALMAMPAAKGLFHRAIVESGSLLRGIPQKNAKELADAIVGELGLGKESLAKIQSLPLPQLLNAAQKVLNERRPKMPGGIPNFRRISDSLGFGPVVDGKTLPAHPFDPQAPSMSADVPMIIGTTLNEFVTAINHPEYEAMSDEMLQSRVREIYGEKAITVIAAFRDRTPQAKPFDLWSRIASAGVRESAIQQAKLKVAQGSAPAYLYWFTWQTPILSGRPRAFHCAEIAFVFDNTDRCETMTGGGAEARALAGKMCDAWIQFARTGNPNHAHLPRWPAFSAAQPTMIFDNVPSVAMNPDGAEQKSIAES